MVKKVRKGKKPIVILFHHKKSKRARLHVNVVAGSWLVIAEKAAT
jgi:hypothetical protein